VRVTPRHASVPVIAIDGPSGSGKGTVSRLVGQRLGWHLLDSGALYRVLALAAERRGVALEDKKGLLALAASLEVHFESEPQGEVRVALEGEDVSEGVRSEACGISASHLAVLSGVRSALLERQRAFRREPGLVADGRDMGTVVFPDAVLKIFLTASPEERAKRRYKQLKEKGVDVNFSDLLQDIAERDRRDTSRAVAPLEPAPNAEVFDTTHQSIEEVVEHVMVLASQRLQRGRGTG
jgi:cytidylate kinase